MGTYQSKFTGEEIDNILTLAKEFSGSNAEVEIVDLINTRLTTAGNYTLNDSMLNYDVVIVEANLQAEGANPSRNTTLTIVPSMIQFPTNVGRYILHIADTKATTWNSMACEVMFGFNSDTELAIQRTVLGSSVTDRTYGISHIYGLKFKSSSSAQSSGSSTPIGTIIPYMGLTAPQDYLVCDGAILNISDYPKLAEHFETQFGSKNHFGGDGTTTFAIPDLRNEFLRGYHNNKEEQLSGEVGIHQDATSQQRMYVNTNKQVAWYVDANTDVSNTDTKTNASTGYRVTTTTYTPTGAATSTYTSRPTNVAVLFCIKCTESNNGGNSSESVCSTKKQVLFEGEWTTTGALSEANLLNDSIYNYDIVYVTTFQRKNEEGATYTRMMTFEVMPDLIQEHFTGSYGNTLWTVECNTGNNLGYAMEGNFGDGTQIAISTLTTQSNATSRLHGICKVVGIKY